MFSPELVSWLRVSGWWCCHAGKKLRTMGVCPRGRSRGVQVQAADGVGGGGAAPAGLLFAHSSSSQTTESSSHLMVEVGKGGHLLFASQVGPRRQSRGSGVNDYGQHLMAEVVGGRGLSSSVWCLCIMILIRTFSIILFPWTTTNHDL